MGVEKGGGSDGRVGGMKKGVEDATSEDTTECDFIKVLE